MNIRILVLEVAPHSLAAIRNRMIFSFAMEFRCNEELDLYFHFPCGIMECERPMNGDCSCCVFCGRKLRKLESKSTVKPGGSNWERPKRSKPKRSKILGKHGGSIAGKGKRSGSKRS